MSETDFVYFFLGSPKPVGNRNRPPQSQPRHEGRKKSRHQEFSRTSSYSSNTTEPPREYIAWTPEKAFFRAASYPNIVTGGTIWFNETRGNVQISRFNPDGTPTVAGLTYLGAAPRDKVIRLSGRDVRISQEAIERLSYSEFQGFVKAVNKLSYELQPASIFGCNKPSYYSGFHISLPKDIAFAPEMDYTALKAELMRVRPSRPGVMIPMDQLRQHVEKEKDKQRLSCGLW